jgi:AraC family transcriptional regulator
LPQTGSIAICPVGADYSVDVEGSVAAILIAVDPGQFALAAAEGGSLEAQLIERLSGHDQMLLTLAQRLATECADSYPNGPFFWNAAASSFIDGLLARHSAKSEVQTRGKLSMTTLDRIRDYVLAHLGEPIDVAALANIAGRSSFHFTRVFTRSVGVTPYRYIVYLRLRRALELVRDGSRSLAEIAVTTGFADQSHLSRWVRRVHGVSPTQLAV